MKIPQSTFYLFQNRKIAKEELSSLVDYTAEKVLQELCRVNQYFSFSGNDVFVLKNMYRNLYQTILLCLLTERLIKKTGICLYKLRFNVVAFILRCFDRPSDRI
jgi:hypothetical protein